MCRAAAPNCSELQRPNTAAQAPSSAHPQKKADPSSLELNSREVVLLPATSSGTSACHARVKCGVDRLCKWRSMQLSAGNHPAVASLPLAAAQQLTLKGHGRGHRVDGEGCHGGGAISARAARHAGVEAIGTVLRWIVEGGLWTVCTACHGQRCQVPQLRACA